MAFGILVLIVILVWSMVGPLTEGIMDFFHFGAVYHGSRVSRTVTLTFDDGPDPRYTPKLLALLKEYEAKAIFFVVGQKAEQHPEIVRAIQRAGHLVGSHTYSHVNAWFVSPWRIVCELKKTSRILEGITGEPVRYYRPPWGRINLFGLLATRSLGMVTVLWSLAAKDWRNRQSSEELFARVAKDICNGDIVLLHDASARDGTPDHTLQTLSALLPRLREIGFTCSLEALVQGAGRLHKPRFRYTRPSQRLLVPVWLLWERLFDKLYRVYPMSRLFRLSMVAWRFGERQVQVPLAYAELASRGALEVAATASEVAEPAAQSHLVTIQNGTPMVELHMQNETLQEFVHIESPERMAVFSLKVLRDSLHHVAQALLFDDRFKGASGIFGVTLMHRGVERLGFHIEEIEATPANRWMAKLLIFIMVLYHPQGRKRLQSGLQEMRPKLLWMTREELINRYYKG